MAAIIANAISHTASNRYFAISHESLIDAFTPHSISTAVSCVIKARSREFSFSRDSLSFTSAKALRQFSPVPGWRGNLQDSAEGRAVES